MAVKIRLSRIGKKNRPYWRIVAVDSRDKRDGECLENLGTYDPIRHEIVQLHKDKIDLWVSKGAQCSLTVKKLIATGKIVN
jgi:small subunit ribosomal protein S16